MARVPSCAPRASRPPVAGAGGRPPHRVPDVEIRDLTIYGALTGEGRAPRPPAQASTGVSDRCACSRIVSGWRRCSRTRPPKSSHSPTPRRRPHRGGSRPRRSHPASRVPPAAVVSAVRRFRTSRVVQGQHSSGVPRPPRPAGAPAPPRRTGAEPAQPRTGFAKLKLGGLPLLDCVFARRVNDVIAVSMAPFTGCEAFCARWRRRLGAAEGDTLIPPMINRRSRQL
jgi:hypothetical protein